MTPSLALWLRLIRRGALALSAALIGYVLLEAWAFGRAYPNDAARASLTTLADNPAVRMLQGVPRAVDTTGGYVVWDGGWFILAVLGVWSVVVTSRLTRGEEDSDRVAWVLAGPQTARSILAAQLAAMITACAVTGGGVTAMLLLARTPPVGALLFGSAVAAFGATVVAATALLAQVCPTRRRTLVAAGGVLAIGYLVRMAANSSEGRSALSWLSPFGWVDQVRPYAGDRVWALTPLVVTAAAMSLVALRMRERRDLGAALLRADDTRSARHDGLSGPESFEWRTARGVVLGWTAALAGYALVLGSVTPAVTAMVERDPGTRSMLEAMGMGATLTDRGVLAFLGPTLALVVALHACWRVGAARHEEAAGLADVILARSVTRRHWLGAHLFVLSAATVVLCLGTAVALWVGAELGGAEVTPADTLAVAFGPLPLVILVGGVAVLLLAAIPRHATVLPLIVTAVAYLLATLGPTLHIPSVVVGLSPFDHLSRVPVESFDALAAAGMCGIGVAAGLVGMQLLTRRDLIGA
jgi:ABC-2 type transport system permease protein